jgi:hypothetical protein
MCRKFFYLTSLVLVLSMVGISSAQVDPALVGWWKFDEGSGAVAADSSGNGNDGTLHGPVEWVAEGKIGGAMAFTGPYNYVLVPNDNTLNPTNTLTIAAWINPSWTGNNRILQKSSGGGDNQYRLLKEWGNNMVFHLPGLSPDRLEFVGLPPAGEWTHLAATYDGSSMKVYYNGVVAGQQASTGKMTVSDGNLCIGTKHVTAPAGDEYNGMLDDVRIYNGALTASEIIVLGGDLKASAPFPADRAIYEDTWATLTWTAGYAAVSHDVYMSVNLDEVVNGAPEAFRGNQASTYFVVGFPGFPFPDGLVAGTTYYWRIDEVDESNPDSPWKGGVWSFTVPPRTAWKPIPPDQARLVDPNTNLSWTGGWGAKTYTVYFGDNFDDVNNATGGTSQLITTYALESLELGKTYYWRVDEFDGRQTYKGNIWSFITGDASLGGIKGEYFNNVTLAGTPALTRVDSSIDFNWGGNSPGPGVKAPVFSVRWTGMLNVPYAETYTFYANVFEAVRLWVDDQLIVSNWMAHHMAIEYQSKKIYLEGGIVPIVMEIANVSGGGYGGGGNMQAQLSWENPTITKQIIPQTALLLPVWAMQPSPSNGAESVTQTPILRWTAGDDAASHDVYFGTDEQAIRNADTSSPEYKGAAELGKENFDPGKLEWDTAYYWRIDAVNDLNPASPWVGEVWGFKTANFLVIDDFEAYDIGNNEIWWSWKDGLGYGAHGDEPAYPGNGTGAAVGDESTASYMEENIIHGGSKSLPVAYDNNKQGAAKYSEVELTLGGIDLTENGGATLKIYFRGIAENAADPLYVSLNGGLPVVNDDPAAAQIGVWMSWDIPLQAFVDKGADVTNVTSIALGIGTKGNTTTPGGTGTMYFDDIGVH